MGMTGDEVALAEAGAVLVGVVVAPFVVPAAAARFFKSDQVRSSFWRMYLPLAGFCFMTMNSQWFTLRKSSKYSTDQWYLDTSDVHGRPWSRVSHHFIRNTRVIKPCVTSTHTLGKSGSPNCLHMLSLKPLTRS